MSEEPLYCMICGEEDCEHTDGWHPDNPDDMKFCHFCGCSAKGGSCAECDEDIGALNASVEESRR